MLKLTTTRTSLSTTRPIVHTVATDNIEVEALEDYTKTKEVVDRVYTKGIEEAAYSKETVVK